MTILTVGIDLAKNVFAVHGVNAAGAVLLRQPKVARAKLNTLVGALPPCTIGIEACSGAHHWVRRLRAMGLDARPVAAKFGTLYRTESKVLRAALADVIEAASDALTALARRVLQRAFDHWRVLDAHL